MIRKKDESLDDDAEPASFEKGPPPPPPGDDDADDDLDLDLEEVGDGDRLKEGFTGQER